MTELDEAERIRIYDVACEIVGKKPCEPIETAARRVLSSEPYDGGWRRIRFSIGLLRGGNPVSPLGTDDARWLRLAFATINVDRGRLPITSETMELRDYIAATKTKGG